MSLLTAAAVHRRSDRVVRVTGPDRLDYLNRLLSQQLEGVAAGTAADFLHLDAKGNPKAMGRALVHADGVWLVVPPACAASLADELDRMRFLLQVEVVDEEGRFAVASVRGPEPLVEAPGAPSRLMTAAPHGPGLVVRDRSGGVDLVGPADWVAERVAGLALPEASAEDWEAWRIGAGVPAWGAEVAAGRRPQELGLLPTHVHLRKGCYPGQESIAKVYNLGRPRRALVVLEAAGPVAAGDAVTIAGAPRPGEVTSAAPSGAAWVALALVPVGEDGEPPAGHVDVGGHPARIRTRVGAGVEQPGAQPILRGGAATAS